MKRNMDTIRRILLLTESLGPEGEHPENLPYKSSWVDGVEEVEFYYHVKILDDAGYIIAINFNREFNVDTNMSGPERFYPETLTWKGHEFLDSIRDSIVWEKTKKH
ncbi:hypothetical protein J2Z32_004330 [Paenibacillus turicensis]|uniref:Uncharacterized protein n=1 Tax=Paenibacillus turicensis TaxID=160487 RepID=A0ABS4FYJ6_9BACL|nr:hypothetical protein [Paenibacillus turicensis]